MRPGMGGKKERNQRPDFTDLPWNLRKGGPWFSSPFRKKAGVLGAQKPVEAHWRREGGELVKPFKAGDPFLKYKKHMKFYGTF